ncbi:maleylacetate reductase [Amycolatopsis orientalis]|uniref:maleylacetate reductase n=1 Tax=Amycolatopsis orientalis TaxID=31958 RepID=UPI0003A65699|nr:maleylacetate reductase [Amycolatopsis orientalis]
MTAFAYNALPGRVVFGRGAARTQLAAEAEDLGAKRILVIAAGAEADLATELCAQFSDRIAATFTDVRPHVPIEVAEQARAAADGVDLVLSVGGGSTTGTAKAVALTTGLPILAVPTTYAGSEVTPVWGLTEAGRKTTGTDPRVLPRTVVYDPDLTRTLPPGLAVASALNAMAHCVEAFWASRRNPVSGAIAEDGIRHLAAGLADPASTGELLLGAYLAGAAFAGAGSGLHHKICHALGGALDLPHAQTHAIVLPYVLAFNAPHAADAASRIARALGVPDPVAGLHRLGARSGIPAGLRELGMAESDVDTVLAEIDPPVDNPRPVTAAGLRSLLHAAWAGTEPEKDLP